RSPSPTWMARTVASYGETSGVSIFIASSTTSGCRAATFAPGSTRTRITVPGIGATTSDCSCAPEACAPATASTSGAGRGGGGAGDGGGGRGGGGGKVHPPRLAPHLVRRSSRRLREGRVLGQKRGRDAARADQRVPDEPAQEREVRRDAADLRLL